MHACIVHELINYEIKDIRYNLLKSGKITVAEFLSKKLLNELIINK